MVAGLLNKAGFRTLFYSLPVQLFFVHLKHNLLLLLFWGILLGIISGNLGSKFGLTNLFLSPEYLGQVGFWSYLILGFSCGGFIMAFHIATYILHGFRFPFLATVSRPFMKFSFNNFLFPLIFLLFYIYFLFDFQYRKELLSSPEIFFNILSFLVGNGIFIFIAFTYFLSTNKDLFKLFGIGDTDDVSVKKSKYKPVVDVFHKNEKWHRRFNKNDEWYTETYLIFPFRLSLCRDCSHYDREMLDSVFRQNHLNAAFFEVLVIATLLGLGLFREIQLFLIPAGATIFILFTMFIMLTSAMYSWLKSWTAFVFIAALLFFNHLSGKEFFNHKNPAYGLDYSAERAEYSNEYLREISYDEARNKSDFQAGLEILENRKSKILQKFPGKKPKFIIYSCSGGGTRAALWTLYTFQYTDSILNGKLYDHTHLITGSSGGLIGAAYLREVYLRSQTDPSVNPFDKKWREKISMDLLNPIAFTMVVNDMFFRFQKFKDGNYTYLKDRGYTFERQLNINTDFFLDKRLSDYTVPEREALIPSLLITPTIINEGRRLIISSQPVSYLSNNQPPKNVSNDPLPEAVEFSAFFKNQDADNLRFTSALRMNATFPYVLPVVSLPSIPSMDIMDGGIRDNYGMKAALNYIYAYKEWLAENTDGVIIIQTRDKFKEWPMEQKPVTTTLENLSTPLGSFYGNFDKIQNLNHDELIQFAGSWFKGTIDIVDFHLNDKDENISLSFHLTSKEKKAVMESINLKENRQAVKKIVELLR
jgi:hypothetical protein